MQVQRPDGTELIGHGIDAALEEELRSQLQAHPGSKGRLFSQGEVMTLRDGTRMRVGPKSLQVVDEKKKECNRKKNKAARSARKKSRKK